MKKPPEITLGGGITILKAVKYIHGEASIA